MRPVLGAWQVSWAPTIEKSKALIAPSLLLVVVMVVMVMVTRRRRRAGQLSKRAMIMMGTCPAKR